VNAPSPLSILAALALAGCAAQSESIPDGLAQPTPAAAPAPASAATIPAAPGGYKLTAAEEKLGCPQLTGQMRVRITQMRSAVERREGTTVSQTAQNLVTPVFGGTRRGIDPAADLQQDRAKLEAFNKRLAEKKCKTLDLDAELRGETPAPAAASKRS
jgi:hypothetical protein